jgi:hypothetical protein
MKTFEECLKIAFREAGDTQYIMQEAKQKKDKNYIPVYVLNELFLKNLYKVIKDEK